MAHQQLNALREQMRKNEPNPLARVRLKREVSGTTLLAEVSPCSWLYPDTKFQVTITMEGGGDAILVKDILFSEATEQDVQELLDQVKVIACSKCGKPAFDPETVTTNREGTCEDCFMTEINSRMKAAQAKEKQDLAKQDVKHKKDGFTHRVSAWVHPTHGNDFLLHIWANQKPTKAAIRKELQKHGSTVFNDYQVTPL